MRALMFLAPGFEEIEAITVIDLLRRAEIEIVTAGTVPGPLLASRRTRHLADMELGSLESALSETFDLLIIPGGNEGVANLKADPRVSTMLRRQRESGGWVAAICAGPTLLVETGWLQDEKLTCHPSLQDKLPAAQLDPSRRVVVSGKLITSLAAGSAMEFAFAIIRQFLGEEAVQKVNQGVVALPAVVG